MQSRSAVAAESPEQQRASLDKMRDVLLYVDRQAMEHNTDVAYRVAELFYALVSRLRARRT